MMKRAVLAGLSVWLLAGCGMGGWSSSSPIAPAVDPGTLQARRELLGDSAGDALAVVDSPPDLVSGDVMTTTGGSLTLGLQFAPRTFTLFTVLFVYIDLDRNPASGFIEGAAEPTAVVSGWEYRVRYPVPTDFSKASIQRATSATTFETLSATFSAKALYDVNWITLSGEARWLELDDHNHPSANLRVLAFHQSASSPWPLLVSDYMPDVNLAPKAFR